ncbi:MAG: 3-hydroxyacyl-CoA dehydrogenase NAD-binding domain-containing protein [Verrucomicrobia subdivision 3 bacterium]|nr:3-hydroxyacyl-CoA dehydrogenase NAD-binding domain-containing protein [Limisphaerales bacterium]
MTTTLECEVTREQADQMTQSPITPALIRSEITDDQICVVTFDRPDSAANIFDRGALEQLHQQLDSIAADSRVRGIIFASGKKSIFITGADLHSISKCDDPRELEALIHLGQTVFDRIAGLRVPTIAAIHGACVGGGYELCLACNYRIATFDKATKIGLPETQLGILPAWGGSTRLPRLIGLPKALDVILGGKTLAPKQALKLGMVDELVHREYLLDYARSVLLKSNTKLMRRKVPLMVRLSNTRIAARLISKKVQPQLHKKTRGHYPALPKALEVVTEGITRSFPGSLELERRAIVELAQSSTARNLVRVFFLQERAKKLTVGVDTGKTPVRHVAVIGAGVMGAGIAQWSAAREIQVLLRDVNPEQVGKGMSSIAKLLQEGVKRRVFTPVEARAAMDRVVPMAADVPLRKVDIIIEAAVEKMDLKKQIFRRLDELAGLKTILATNTSALSVSELAAATLRPERVVGIHFFNPVHRMQLVEVVVGKQTSPEVVSRAVRFVQQLGKLPVVVNDSPGFLVNRILMPYLIEAGHLFENGASVENIDESMLEFGMPMGPLRLIDEVGVDVSNHVAETISAHFSPRLRTPSVLGSMLNDGLLGRKSSRGYYLHDKKSRGTDVNPHVDKYQKGTSAAALSRDELRSRMVFLMINEAARCLEEGVVSEPADVDFGMIMGTGFAPFRGGPLRFADEVGIPQIAEEMYKLAHKGEAQFAPCRLLELMAARQEKFYAATRI